jgi:L-erythro-3,5-diaminohexanoate dehydrogenase
MPAFHPMPNPLGIRRVLLPASALPQAAQRLDAQLPAYQDEIVIDVETLNIDAASFVQMEGVHAAGGPDVGQQITAIVAERGKMQNPVTGSGGMLLGRVAQLGPQYNGPLAGAQVGQRVATLVSLTLTPLQLHEIMEIVPHAHQVHVRATAILPSSAPAALVPDDLPASLVLAVLDVCGAPAQVARLVAGLPQNGHVLCIGAGKAGTLALAAARDIRPDLRLWAVDRFEQPLRDVLEAGLCDGYAALDASDALAVREAALRWTEGRLCDAVVQMASLPNTEMAAILACKPRGTCLYFSMATSFAQVALGAEGVGADVDLLIGNGYLHDHAQMALMLVRRQDRTRGLLERRLGL